MGSANEAETDGPKVDPHLFAKTQLGGDLANVQEPRSPIATGGVVAGVLGLCWPFLCVALLPGIVILGMVLRSLKSKQEERNLARPNVLGLEASSTLIVIPLVGAVGTLGVSWAFYLINSSDTRVAGQQLLVMTGAVALSFPIAIAITLFRHRSGSDPLPFEDDVDPRRGSDACAKRRRQRPGGFLPATTVAGINRAEAELWGEIEARGESRAKPTSVSIKSTFKDGFSVCRDRGRFIACHWFQLFLTGGFALAWIVVPLAFASLHLRLFSQWWTLPLAVALSVPVSVISIWLDCRTEFYQRLSLGLREYELRERLQVQKQAGKDAQVLSRLDESQSILLEEVRALRSQIAQLQAAQSGSVRWRKQRRRRR